MTGDAEPDMREARARADLMLRGAALAGRRSAARDRSRLADFASEASVRLDDRLRALLHHQLAGMTSAIEARLRDEATRLLLARGEREAAERLRGEREVACTRLAASGRLADPALLTELAARLRQDLIAERLPLHAGSEDEPSLLVRLAEVANSDVAAAARALLLAENRRFQALVMADVERTDLPAELHQQLVWRIAAAVRGEGGAAIDRALSDAATRLLAAHDEGDRPEALAMRLALAIDARPQELPTLLDEAIADRRLSLVVAALAWAGGLSFDQVRALLIEPEDERWWLLLRAIDLSPLTIARLGLALAQADRRRADHDLPATLDAVHAVTQADARRALATLRLPEGFRMAVEGLVDGSVP